MKNLFEKKVEGYETEKFTQEIKVFLGLLLIKHVEEFNIYLSVLEIIFLNENIRISNE